MIIKSNKCFLNFYEKRFEQILKRFSPDSPLYDLGDLFRIFILSSLLKEYPNRGVTVDLGCGPGLLLSTLSFYAEFVIGIDISAKALKFTKKKLRLADKPYDLIRADVQHIPFKDDSVDYIVLIETLEHIPSEEMVVQEIARVLRENQVLILSIPNLKPFPFSINWIQKVMTGKFAGDPQRGHLRRYNSESIRDLLADKGIKSVKQVTYGHIFLEITEMINVFVKKIFSRLGSLYEAIIFPFLVTFSRLDQKLHKLERSHGIFLVAKKIGIPTKSENMRKSYDR